MELVLWVLAALAMYKAIQHVARENVARQITDVLAWSDAHLDAELVKLLEQESGLVSDEYSKWLWGQAVLYIKRAEEPTLSDDALLYFAGLRDGFTKAYIRYQEEQR